MRWTQACPFPTGAQSDHTRPHLVAHLQKAQPKPKHIRAGWHDNAVCLGRCGSAQIEEARMWRCSINISHTYRQEAGEERGNQGFWTNEQQLSERRGRSWAPTPPPSLHQHGGRTRCHGDKPRREDENRRGHVKGGSHGKIRCFKPSARPHLRSSFLPPVPPHPTHPPLSLNALRGKEETVTRRPNLIGCYVKPQTNASR